MGIRRILKKSEVIVGLGHYLRKILGHVKRKRAVPQYLQSHTVRKLQIGSGPNHIPGWLTTDIVPRSNDVVYLDATQPFPMADGTFDYVFSEHLIEHISWQNGLRMLRECRRVLNPGGIVRIATPDLAVMLGLYREDRDALADRYIEWITDRFLPDIEMYKASFVINNAFRNWGHQFLYDEELLEMAMRQAGFTDIVRFAPGESAHTDLRGIEMHGVAVDNDEMNAFETMVFEGTRPGKRSRDV